jgi:hypothetical protein
MNKPSPAADSVALAATSKSDETEVASISVPTEVTPVTTEIAAPDTVSEPLPAEKAAAPKAAKKVALKKTAKKASPQPEVAAAKIAKPKPEKGTAKKETAKKKATPNKSKSVKKVTAVNIKKSEPKTHRERSAAEKSLAKLLKLLKTYGIEGAVQLMQNPQPVAEATQGRVAKKAKMSQGRRGRKPGWTKYTPKQEAHFAKLLKKHGVSPTQKILAAYSDEELGQLRNQKLFPQPLQVSASVLNRIIVRDKLTVPNLRGRKKGTKVAKTAKAAKAAKAAKVAKTAKAAKVAKVQTTEAQATAKTGRPKKYTGDLAKHMVRLVREHNISMAAQILNAPKGKLVQYRNTMLVPKPLGVSVMTLSRMAHEEGIEIIRGRKSTTPKSEAPAAAPAADKTSTSAPTRGRQKGWVKYKGALAKHMLSLVRKYNLSMAAQILNAPKGKLVKLRNKTLVPKSLGVSVMTLSKMAHTAGIPITRGRQSAA